MTSSSILSKRHADTLLATTILTTSQQSDTLCQDSASVAGCFARAALQVGSHILPDVKCAVTEKELALVASLLATVDEKLSELGAYAEDMQQQHVQLHHRVQILVSDTQGHTLGSELPEAISCTTKLGMQLDSPRSVQSLSTECDSSSNGDQTSDDGYQSSDDGDEPLNRTTSMMSSSHKNVALDTSSHIDFSQSQESGPRIVEVLGQVDRRVDVDLAFWQSMNATVQKLTQMKRHASCLLQFPSSSEVIRARAEQRLDDFATAWASLERSCKQYVAEHDSSLMPLQGVHQESDGDTDCNHLMDSLSRNVARLNFSSVMQSQ